MAAPVVRGPKVRGRQTMLSSIFLAEITGKAGATYVRLTWTGDLLELRFCLYRCSSITHAQPPVVHRMLPSLFKCYKTGKQVIAAPPQPISTTGVTDLTRLPYGAEIPLSGFPPGRYALRLRWRTVRPRLLPRSRSILRSNRHPFFGPLELDKKGAVSISETAPPFYHCADSRARFALRR